MRSIWKDTGPTRLSFAPLTRELQVDVAIIGAGITGLTAAMQLKSAGRQVIVLEAGTVGAGTSGYTTAHLTTLPDQGFYLLQKLYGKEVAQDFYQSMKEAIDSIESTVRSHSIDCSFQRVPGYYFTEDDPNDVLHQFKAVRDLGLNPFDLTESPVPFKTICGFRISDQAQFHIQKYLNALAELIHDGQQVQIFENTHVRKLRDGNPCQLEIDGGLCVSANSVIQATHTPLGKNLLHSMLGPYRSYVIGVTLRDDSIGPGLYWDNAEPYHYIRKAQGPQGPVILIGGADHKTAHGSEEVSYAQLEEYARQRFSVDQVIYRWSSQFYEPADHLPMIGLNPFASHTYIATGFSGDGMVHGTSAGVILAKQILGLETPYDTLFSPSRIRRQGISTFLKENFDVAKAFFSDRFPGRPGQDEIDPSELPAGEGGIVRSGTSQYAIYRDDHNQLKVFDAVCPHMKCVVRWNPSQKTFDCPCHGSRFGCDGKVIQGPSLRDLSSVETEMFEEKEKKAG